jgi:hypothetical protein
MSVVDVPLQLGYIHIRLNNKCCLVVLVSHVILALTIRSGVVSCIFFAFASNGALIGVARIVLSMSKGGNVGSARSTYMIKKRVDLLEVY